MGRQSVKQILVFLASFLVLNAANFAQHPKVTLIDLPPRDNNYLLRFGAGEQEQGYRNYWGDTVIPVGKYDWCFTDTFRTFAIVHKRGRGFVGIDRDENILYQVHNFDNGPDYPSEGLFRIIDKGKYGFADAKTGKIVIKPQFEAAFPFKNLVAKVGDSCILKSDGEYHYWVCKNCYLINRLGQKVGVPSDKD